MALSCTSARGWLLSALAAGAPAGPYAFAAAPTVLPAHQLPITVDAASSEVEFRDNHIARATASGKPAQFEQPRADSQQMARGHADEIVYDVNEGTVRLSNDAWLSDGVNEISGPLLVYNIRAQRVQAATQPGSDQRVHITITPQSAPAQPTGKPHAEPGKPPPTNPRS